MKLHITIECETAKGAKDALWQVWTSINEGAKPVSGLCSRSMGDPYDYEVKTENFVFLDGTKEKP